MAALSLLSSSSSNAYVSSARSPARSGPSPVSTGICAERKVIQGLPSQLPLELYSRLKALFAIHPPTSLSLLSSAFSSTRTNIACPRRRVNILDPVLHTELLERFLDELWPIVQDEGMRYPKSTLNVPLYKLDELCCHDLGISFQFRPLGEIISGHLSRPYPRLGEDRGRDMGLRLLYLSF